MTITVAISAALRIGGSGTLFTEVLHKDCLPGLFFDASFQNVCDFDSAAALLLIKAGYPRGDERRKKESAVVGSYYIAIFGEGFI